MGISIDQQEWDGKGLLCFSMAQMYVYSLYTLPETNIAPENRPSPKGN